MSLTNIRFVSAIVALSSIFFIRSVEAQEAKVVKVQGRRAIVQFPDDARPRVGQRIDLSAGATSIGGGGSGSTGDRSKIIGGSAELSNLTISGSSSATTILSFDGRYGWNDGVMEYGGLGSLFYRSTSATSLRLLGVGGFFDYNLVPNTPGTELVYGGAAVGQLGQISTAAGTNELSGTYFQLDFGGQLKWFPLGNTVAIRADALYRIESVSDSVRNSGLATGSGLIVKGGLYVYF